MEEEAGVPDWQDEPDVRPDEVAKFKYILDEEAGIKQRLEEEDDGRYILIKYVTDYVAKHVAKRVTYYTAKLVTKRDT